MIRSIEKKSEIFWRERDGASSLLSIISKRISHFIKNFLKILHLLKRVRVAKENERKMGYNFLTQTSNNVLLVFNQMP